MKNMHTDPARIISLIISVVVIIAGATWFIWSLIKKNREYVKMIHRSDHPFASVKEVRDHIVSGKPAKAVYIGQASELGAKQEIAAVVQQYTSELRSLGPVGYAAATGKLPGEFAPLLVILFADGTSNVQTLSHGINHTVRDLVAECDKRNIPVFDTSTKRLQDISRHRVVFDRVLVAVCAVSTILVIWYFVHNNLFGYL